jgi:5-methylcytosine-specific restriction protein A
VHPVKVGTFADRGRGTRQQRGYGADWTRKRAQVMERDLGLCQPCQRRDPPLDVPATEVDHVVSRGEAKRRGWTKAQAEDDSNLQAICRACHQAKTQAEAAAGRGRG